MFLYSMSKLKIDLNSISRSNNESVQPELIFPPPPNSTFPK